MSRSNIGDRVALLVLHQILLELTDEEHPLSRREIENELEKHGVINRMKYSMFRNNISALIESGEDVIGIRSHRDYRYYIGKRLFDLAELKFLVDVVQSSHFSTNKKTKQIANKLSLLTSRARAKDLQRHVCLTGSIKSKNEKIFYNLDIIHAAVNSNRKISFKYYQWNLEKKLVPKHEGKVYVISPYTLVFDRENYYMVGYEEQEEKIKHFRVDKIVDAAIISENRSIRKEEMDKSIGTYQSMYFGMYGGVEERVTIEFDNSLIGVVLDRFGTELRISRCSDTRFSICTKISVSDQFFGWVFSLGGSARIISPVWVVDDFVALKSVVFNQYEFIPAGES